MNPALQKLDEKTREIINQINKFGFEFYGFDENNYPLVKANTGQIVPLGVAVEFVNNKIIENKNTGSGSIEDMPETPDQNLEVQSEDDIETSLETPRSSDQNPGTTQKEEDLEVQKKSPEVTLVKAGGKPYGFGFTPTSFNPADVKQALNFINRNSKTKNISSNKWLAIQFKKFIDEMNDGKIQLNND